MQAGEINKLLKVRPFESFRMRMTDGSSVVIRHPEQALVTARRMFIALPSKQSTREPATLKTDKPADDWMVLDPIHVVSIEPNGDHKPKTRSKKPRQH
ncbi:MAG: hypothetical protein R3E58_14045 [Phycisphaerae bacterium]